MRKVACKNNIDLQEKLTVDKLYEIIETNGEYYKLMDDRGIVGDFFTWRFMEIDLFREKQLDKLNIRDDS